MSEHARKRARAVLRGQDDGDIILLPDSMPLVVSSLPQMLARGEDPVAVCVQRGRQLGFIRPSSRTTIQAPQVAAHDIIPRLAELVLEREPRYRADPGQPGRGRRQRPKTPPGPPTELTTALYACLVS